MEKDIQKELFYDEFKQIRSFIYDFFNNYYIKRDADKVLDMVSDNILCIGMGKTEIAKNKSTFEKFMRLQMEGVSEALPYTVKDYIQIPCGCHFWACYAEIEMTIRTENWGRVDYDIRFTSLCHIEDGICKFDVIHTSEANGYKSNYCTINEAEEGQGCNIALTRNKEQLDILNYLVPGGVVSNYIEDDFPLSFTNDQFLRITDFNDFDEVVESSEGSYLNLIHEDDRERYIYNANFALETGKQCECEYRIKNKNGNYIWVHDITHHAISSDGKGRVISALTNIQDQVNLRNMLENENKYDSLTGIFNRKYGTQKIEDQLSQGKNYAFCIIDLDNFKKINDIYGHQEGDNVLRYIASLLSSSFRSTDIVMRLGGDEFIVFITNYNDIEYIKNKVDIISDYFKKKMDAKYPKANSSLSIGGVYSDKPLRFYDLYKSSDKILYDIKNSEKNKFVFKEI